MNDRGDRSHDRKSPSNWAQMGETSTHLKNINLNVGKTSTRGLPILGKCRLPQP